MAYADPTWRRRFAWASTAVSAAGTTLYLVLIIREADDAFWDIFPWALVMLVGTGAALTAALAGSAKVARRGALAATAVLGILGIIGIFSIGLVFLLAAMLAGLAAVRPTKSVAA